MAIVCEFNWWQDFCWIGAYDGQERWTSTESRLTIQASELASRGVCPKPLLLNIGVPSIEATIRISELEWYLIKG